MLNDNERIDDLQINNLKIIQNITGFCFGIDSVLLANFAKNIKDNSNVIDLGTGTGIIPILLSAKIKAKSITGVEIQSDVAEMAKRSVKLNNLNNLINIVNADIRNLHQIFEKGKFDVVITNPPYIKENTGAINENNKKMISRHEIKCTIQDIAKISYDLLRDNGEFYMVHRPDRLMDIMENFRKYKLEIKELRFVYSNNSSQANLVLIKATKFGRPFLKVQKPLYVYKENGEYSDDVLKIYNK